MALLLGMSLGGVSSSVWARGRVVMDTTKIGKILSTKLGALPAELHGELEMRLETEDPRDTLEYVNGLLDEEDSRLRQGMHRSEEDILMFLHFRQSQVTLKRQLRMICQLAVKVAWNI